MFLLLRQEAGRLEKTERPLQILRRLLPLLRIMELGSHACHVATYVACVVCLTFRPTLRAKPASG